MKKIWFESIWTEFKFVRRKYLTWPSVHVVDHSVLSCISMHVHLKIVPMKYKAFSTKAFKWVTTVLKQEIKALVSKPLAKELGKRPLVTLQGREIKHLSIRSTVLGFICLWFGVVKIPWAQDQIDLGLMLVLSLSHTGCVTLGRLPSFSQPSLSIKWS